MPSSRKAGESHVYLFVTSEQCRSIFRAAAERVPPQTKWLHRGRDPLVGLDCVGLVLYIYRYANLPIDDIDVPYGEHDSQRGSRRPLLIQQLEKKFVKVGPFPPAFGPFEKFPFVERPYQCWSGDVIVLGNECHNHMGIVLDGVLVEVAKTRIRCTKLEKVWSFITAVYRLRKVLGT